KHRLLAGLALVALLGGTAYFVWGQPGAQSAQPAPEVKTTPIAPPVQDVAVPVRVSIALQASPAAAKLFLDGEALPSNPTTKLLLVDGKAHVLRAEAAGFTEATTEFSPTRDATVKL